MLDKLELVVADALRLDPQTVTEETSTKTCSAWDSLKHFSLIIAVEEKFGIRFSSTVIPELTSVRRLREEISRLQKL